MTLEEGTVSSKRRRQDPRRCCGGLSVKDGLQFLSALILPLMLGVFTVVITFQQQKLSRDQRMEDMQVARQQRLEDRNESRIQRDQEWNISQMAQIAQSKVVIDQYRDEVLIAYIIEMGEMLESKNGSLTSDSLTHTLARVKTLNALRQFDGGRQSHIIDFLYEAGLLTNNNRSLALDISTAKLMDIDFRTFAPSNKIEKLSLAGVYLQNCTFEGMILENINFSSARLLSIEFSGAELIDTHFSFAFFNNVSFERTQFSNGDFSSANVKNVNFSDTRLSNVNFSSAYLRGVDFATSSSYGIDFSNVTFENVNFSPAALDNADFSFANLNDVNFSFVDLQNVKFSSAESANNVDFSSARFSYGSNTFHRAKMTKTMFEKCYCEKVDFSDANLKSSSFQSATLSNTTFTLANLQNADFTKTNITDDQLQSALSIRNAKLPNETLGQGRNLVRNGDANCNISLVDHWQVNNGTIVVMSATTNQSQCQFVLRSMVTGAIMSQRISLVHSYDFSFWESSNVILEAQMSSGVSIELISIDGNGTVHNTGIANSISNTISRQLPSLTQAMDILVKFDAQMSESSWCDDIEVFIDLGS